jgi:transcriptional regulator with GAF, ATPase, and Fis domain
MAQGSSPAGSRPAPATQIITDASGHSVRRLRKLRVTIAATESEGPISHVFAQDEIRIGSSPEADVPLRDASVSREHLAIRLGPDGYQLTDTGSTNGTFIGELRLWRGVVSSETHVRLGKTLVTLTPLDETVEQVLSPRARFGRMLGASAAMRETFALLEKVAASDLTVLVEGETGTGKELVAEGLHEQSARRGAFTPVNCGAIPRELLESELFGHAKGAFTGAVKDREGAFVAAHHGTLFLDEVGELPLDMQAKLLRALERHEVKPVGADQIHKVDVRVVAATNRTLAKEVAAGRFRQDLYYRLAVVTVRIPPLRTRIEDLRLLVDAIQDELGRRRAAQGLPPPERLDDAAMAMLARYDFPGNVRELRNVVERWAVLGASLPPGLDETPAPAVASPEAPEAAASPDALLALPYHEARDAWTERFERAFVREALRRSGGNVSRAARDAGVDRRHLQRLMARFSIRADEQGDD